MALSYAERTVIEMGVASKDSLDEPVARTAGLHQIAVDNVFEGPALQAEVQPRNRSTGLLSAAFAAIGSVWRQLTGEILLYGSGIAQQPPTWWELQRACGFIEYRSSTIPAPTTTGALFAAAASGADGAIPAGSYEYSFSMMYEDDGSTPATTASACAFESQVNEGEAVLVTVSATNHVSITNLPSTGIKRVYRRLATQAVWRLVAEVASGTTAYTDILADTAIGITPGPTPGHEIQFDSTIAATAAATFSATPATGGDLPDATWEYTYAMLYEADGTTLAATGADVVLEGSKGNTDTAITATTDNTVDLANLPTTGRKRIYRRVSGTTRWFLVAELDAASDTWSDVGDADELSKLGTRLIEVESGTNGAISGALNESHLLPAHDYEDFDALTIQTYIDIFQKPMHGTRGTIDWNADEGQNFIGRFTHLGVYAANTATDNPDPITDAGVPPQFCDAEFIIKPSDGAARSPVVKSWGIITGRTPGRRGDGNAPCANAGLREFMIGTRPDPRWTCVIEENKTLDWDWEAEFRSAKKYALRIKAGTAARERVLFSNYPCGSPSAYVAPEIYMAQLIEAPVAGPTGPDGVRTVSLNFLLTGKNWLRMQHAAAVAP